MIVLRKIVPDPSTYRTGTIVADTLVGARDGSNQVYYTTHVYKRNRIDLHINGQALHAPDDFTQSGNNEVTLKYITPIATDDLRATYELNVATYIADFKGSEAVPLGATEQSVTFSTTLSDTSYNVSTELTTTASGELSVYSAVVGNKTTSGFTVYFSGEIDTSNYILEWTVFN